MALSPGIHGVVIVHGIGNPAAGDTIATFTKAVCDTLINSPEGSLKPQVQLKSDVSAKIPTVTLHITSPSGEHASLAVPRSPLGRRFSAANPDPSAVVGGQSEPASPNRVLIQNVSRPRQRGFKP